MRSLWPTRDARLARLVEHAAAGNRKAFRSLYRELFRPVSQYVGRRVSDRADAEDLVAKVFESMLVNLSRYDSARGGVRTWVLAMAKNAIIDGIRTRRSVETLDEPVFADAATSPLDAMVLDEQARRVRALLDDYPPEVREMFALRFGDGLRYREIAELMGLSEAAVKQRFSRALRELRARGGEGEGLTRYAI